MKWQVQNPSGRGFELLVAVVLYVAAGEVERVTPITHGHSSPVWLAAGVAFAILLIRGRYLWVGVAAGSFLVNRLGHASLPAAAGIAIGNALGALIGTALLAREPVAPIKRLNDVFRLIGYGALGTGISALIGPAVLVLTRSHNWVPFPSTALMWWAGDMMGVLLVVPLVLNVAEFKIAKPRLAELGLLVACLLIFSEFLFRQTTVAAAVFGFCVLPFIIWSATRFSIAGAALSSFVVSAFAVCETGNNVGPFAAYGSPLRNFEALQVFMSVITVSGLCLAAVIADRTHMERALVRENKLRLAQEQYRMIIETTNDGVWIIDDQYHTTFVNRRMAEMLGFLPEEMLGHTPFDYVFPEDVARKRADLERRRHGNGREVIYNRFRHKDGSELWATLSTAPIFSDDGERIGALAMLSDVTLLRRTEDALRRSEKLVAAGRLAATISHEVNNPLEAVVNLLYLLKIQPMNDQAKQYLDLTEKEVRRISAITQRTLGFFRDDSAWVELSVAELLEDTLAFYEQRLTGHSIQVVRDYADRGIVSASRSELQQVLANLISNALDALNGSGRLTLQVSMASDNSGTQVVVEDDGAGIAAENLERVFEPFFTTKQNTGTGLGLWVAKEIIQKHGGTISVSSSHGPGGEHGTRFSVFLPRCIDRRAAA